MFFFFFFAAAQNDAKSKNDSNEITADKNSTANLEHDKDSDDSLVPLDTKQQRITEFQRMKANCKSDDLEQIKLKCEILVRDCIAGLLVQLSNEDFKKVEGNWTIYLDIFDQK